MAPRSRKRAEVLSSNDDDSDYVTESRTRKRTKTTSGSTRSRVGKERLIVESSACKESAEKPKLVQHPKSLHTICDLGQVRNALLGWFAGVHDAREMPWRKRYNPNLNPDERNQRAYEVWVSEVMLQQTQVVTVIPYYNRWMGKFPTIERLAESNIEQVNALWKGLGYYSRASRLLAGAQKVVKELGGRLPGNAADLQDKVPGIGRYSAGAICSIAYGERVPVLDGNVHRLLSRFLALHAPPKAKATLDILWGAATELVEAKDLRFSDPDANDDVAGAMARTQYPGDINQALIELGSTVCRVRDPRCDICPLHTWCCALSLSHDPKDEKKSIDLPDMEDLCSLCEPVSDQSAVTAYPMKADRKKARVELDVVSVVEWRLSLAPDRRWFLLVRRPESGLLAGLYEFPTTVNVSKSISRAALPKLAAEWVSKVIKPAIEPFECAKQDADDNNLCLKDIIAVGDVDHVFSHIKKTYRVQWVILEGDQGPPELATELYVVNQAFPDSDSNVTKGAMWCSLNEVSEANIGTGVMKIWNLVKEKWERSRTPDCKAQQLQRMSQEQPEVGPIDGVEHERDYLYSVLNLPKAASQHEINERHRSLSLIFHPDKQHDDKSKEVATRTFLEIQKAYQVLSDPFLREVYDILGEPGLSVKWNESFRRKPTEELRDILKGVERDTREKQLKDQIHPRGRLECSLDVSSLFAPYPGSAQDSLVRRLENRLEDVHIAACSLRHSIHRRLNDKTVLAFVTRLSRQEKQSGVLFMGTIRHQFSPRLSSEITTTLLAPHICKWSADYDDDDNSISLKTSFTPFRANLSQSASLTLSRRLFPHRHERGVLSIHAAQHPQLAFNVLLPSPFSLAAFSDGERPPPGSVPPSVSGLAYGAIHKSFGIVFNSVLPKLVGETGVTFTELSLQLKIGFELGLEGLTWLFTGSWSNESSEITATTMLNPVGVVLKLDLAYLEQHLTLPVILSHQHSPTIALCSVVVPSTALVLGYHFILKPRRRSQRLAHIRAARREQEEDSGAQRERDAVVALLRDASRRHVQNEYARGGLIILEATYGLIDKGDRINDLSQDVTVSLQALVRNSQLHIPGDHPKIGLQGFSDPAPFALKALRIRYLFNGREHYAEMSDDAPIVLPLAGMYEKISRTGN
ncbi:hypothetical protein M378DRAFT_25009 [Amanita muscaria Koide BX008]|uniref:Adenine DNA glycosylase n=1 Tax=Amanita muscaria (strain Koide BX008) TaxID=946122 RepID=A0A0C2X488_AMAMK|nr:hypothetical protein M378DRAFT_25009 [Amanita muscaria Koide BX008]